MLQLEEALLKTDQRNFLIINEGTPPAIVLGASNQVEELIQNDPQVPLIRRFTGGGTVFVDSSTLFVTFIIQQVCKQDEVYDWTASFYQKAHPSLPFSRLETDYVIKDQKIGGNAQYFKKDRFLHHTSFLFDFDEKNMEYLKHPRKAPSYRNNRLHDQFMTKLSYHFATMKAFIDPLISVMQEEFSLHPFLIDSIGMKNDFSYSTRLINV